MIGDGPELDVEGGRRAGLRTCWISHGRPWPEEFAPPDLVFEDTYHAVEALNYFSVD